MGGAGVRPGASLPNPEALSSAGFSRPSPENVPRQRGALGVGTRGQRGPQMVEASGRWRGAPADGGGPGGSLGLSVWGMPGASPRGFSDRGSLPSPANLQASLPIQGLNHSPPLPGDCTWALLGREGASSCPLVVECSLPHLGSIAGGRRCGDLSLLPQPPWLHSFAHF